MATPASADLPGALLNALGPLLAALQGQNAPLPQNPSSEPLASTTSIPAPPVLARYTRPGSATLPSASHGHPNFSGSARTSLPGFNTTLSGYGSGGMGAVIAQPRYPRPPSVRTRPDAAAISFTNDGRRAAMQAHRDSSSAPSQLVQRQPRKRRGPAAHPPGITSNPQAAAVASTYRQNVITHEMTDIAVRNVVFTPNSTPNIALPQQLWSQFIECSESFDLVHDMILDRQTTLGDIHSRVLEGLQRGPAAWKLGGLSTAFARVLRSATVPLLQLLRLNNKGTPRSDGSIMMGRLTLDVDLTLAQLITERAQEFAKTGRQIRDKHLLIFWIMTNSNVSCIASVDGGSRRRHTCVSDLMHAMFCAETSLGVPQDWDNAPECESGGETDDEGEIVDELMDFDTENYPVTPTPEPRGVANERSTTSSSSVTEPSHSLFAQNSAPAVSARTAAAPVSARQPLTLRGYGKPFLEWTPPTGTASLSEIYQEYDQARAAYKAASEGSADTETLLVEGTDMADMVASLIHQFGKCAATGEHDLAMSTLRSFSKISINEATGARRIISEGNALEREVIFTAWHQFTHTLVGTHLVPRTEFLLQRADEFYSIATTPALQSASFISPKRRTSLHIFGMLTAQMVLHGMSIAPLVPALILMIVYGFDMHCLTRAFISEWHPELSAHIAGIIEGGADGDLSPYESTIASYLGDCQLAQFRDRTEAQNLQLASDILYRGTIGTALPGNAELRAFHDGFNSACSNGFSMTELLRSAPGGVPLVLSHLYATTIESFSDFMKVVSVTGPARSGGLAMCAPTNILRGKPLRGIFGEFLSRTGVPIPKELTALVSTGTLSPIVDLADVDHPAFRSRIACHAICGNPHLPAAEELEQIKVYFVLPDDPIYRAHSLDAAFNYRHGNILIRACFRSAYIPIGFLYDLGEHQYPATDADGNPTAPHSLEEAIDNWLLLQFLNSIGGHTIM